MFFHSFKYSLKVLLKNKTLIFWTLLFPIFLGTFFKLAFSNIENSEKLDVIDIAIVENEEFNNNKLFKETFDTLSDEKNESRMFNTKYVVEEEAIELLNKDKIEGYIKLEENNTKLVFKSSGINQTIIKYVTEEIIEFSDIIDNYIDSEVKNGTIDYNKIYQKVDNLTNDNNIKLKNISNSNLSYTMIEFYTLIAMTCLYGGMLGMYILNKNLANMTNEGKRISLAPLPKYKTILGSVCSSYVVQLIGLLILFLYTIFVLNVDYGSNIFLVILISLAGSFAGLSLGIFVASIIKGDDNKKTGIMISITMLGCFLSGMMGITMKYIIDSNIPVLNKINPVAMITDGLYSLYYYSTVNRFIFDFISLIIFSIILLLISTFSLRRQKYDSI